MKMTVACPYDTSISDHKTVHVSFLLTEIKSPPIILVLTAYSCIDVDFYRTSEIVCCCRCFLKLFQFIVMILGDQGNVQLLGVVNTVMILRGAQKCY
jgi:hypothetical protein